MYKSFNDLTKEAQNIENDLKELGKAFKDKVEGPLKEIRESLDIFYYRLGLLCPKCNREKVKFCKASGLTDGTAVMTYQCKICPCTWESNKDGIKVLNDTD